VRREGYRVTAEFEAGHWWYRARRDLFLLQVAAALRERGAAARRARILDYGCGTGHNIAHLARLGEARGADLASPEALAFREELAAPILDLGSDLREHHGRYDVVTALDVLEHIADDASALSEMARFLVPGGQLVLTVPAYDWLWSGEDVISLHVRRYTRAGLLRVCAAAGLEVRFASYFNLAILPAMAAVVWARRALSRGEPRSNLGWPPRSLNELLYRLAACEARAVGGERLRLPAGASLVCRCALPAAAG
jgi:SAM-dependent methyltransferase